MDSLPEIKQIKEDEIKNADKEFEESHDLEIEMPVEEEPEEEQTIFEKPKKARGRPKGTLRPSKKYDIEEPLPDHIEPDIEEMEIPKTRPKRIGTYKDLVWLNDIFRAGTDEDWVASKRIKTLCKKYEDEHGSLTYQKFSMWAKWRYNCQMTKRGSQAGLNRICIANKDDLMYILASEGEEFAEPVKKVQPKSFDFDEFKTYMSAYEKEKEQARKDKEIEQLKREKQELELEKKYYDKFRRQQMLERQNALPQQPVQSNHIDWSKYRGI
jgi:hypothetical protein